MLNLLSALVLSSTAHAVPMELVHQGVLYDSLGAPLSGANDITFTIYDAPAGGAVLWQETQSLTFDDGFYTTSLGSDSSNAIDESVFDGTTRHLALTVGAGAELPNRLPVVSVPYALMAGQADLAAQADSATVADGAPWAGITGVPGDLADGDDDSFALFSCAGTGQVPVWNGGWSCGAPNDHNHAAEQITSGMLAIERLPVGTGTLQVAPGDHSHTASDIGAVPNASCADGQVLKSSSGVWSCADDIDTTDPDTTLSESEVEGFITNAAINLAAGSMVGNAPIATTLTGCTQVDGACGNGMFNQPTYYFDRVSFACPDATPIMKSFRFFRCGNLGTSNEGLAVRATCCALGQ